ncbi:MAG TPA: hypothetical protein VNI02_22655, partial [Blastocatellia bacterium]|nr:hypothetical protein [Blastocatellia bacterium]
RLNDIAESSLPDSRPPAPGPRLYLHAWQLAFHHPASGEWLEFTSPLPEDFASLIGRLSRKGKES